MYQRFIKSKVEKALTSSPVTLITGPRQAGKTTLAKEFQYSGREYFTFDDPKTLNEAKQDPMKFIQERDKVILDEMQLFPELFRVIKLSVDNDRRYGRFLLTGSANVLEMPEMADSLVGRLRRIELLPLARAEVEGNVPTFLENLFTGNFENLNPPPITINEIINLTRLGGFPEILNETEEFREEWFENYIDSTIMRDFANIALLEKIDVAPDLIELLTAHSGKLLNYTRVSSGLSISYKTVKRYIKLLERLYLIKILRPLHTDARSRIVKTPKIHFIDTGLLVSEAGLTFDQLKEDRDEFGPLLESFVFTEILKLITNSSMRLKVNHFRDRDGHEVDIVLKQKNGTIAGVEVKTGSIINNSDFKGLRILRNLYQNKFAFGVILYNGDKTNFYEDNLVAVPISALWV